MNEPTQQETAANLLKDIARVHAIVSVFLTSVTEGEKRDFVEAIVNLNKAGSMLVEQLPAKGRKSWGTFKAEGANVLTDTNDAALAEQISPKVMAELALRAIDFPEQDEVEGGSVPQFLLHAGYSIHGAFTESERLSELISSPHDEALPWAEQRLDDAQLVVDPSVTLDVADDLLDFPERLDSSQRERVIEYRNAALAALRQRQGGGPPAVGPPGAGRPGLRP